MTNCLFFALALYWRRRAKGARCYIGMRKSESGPFPHFLVFELRRGEYRVISYKPINPRQKTCPPPLFKGRAAWGDAAQDNSTKR